MITKDLGKAFWGTVALLTILTVYSCQVGIISTAGSIRAQGCLAEIATLNVSFDGVESDISAIDSNSNAQLAEIEKAINEAGLSQVVLRSAKFNVTPQAPSTPNGSYQYNVHRTAVYEVSPSDKAVDLMAALVKKGYKVDSDTSVERSVGSACITQGVKTFKAKLNK